jgi:Cd(II)/Pb(II)-responsive transcriptional regulator
MVKRYDVAIALWKNGESAMKIGELAVSAGVETDTIRYYEKAGLLPPPPRAANGYRAYGAMHLERLAFIRHCRALDMPLADVARLLDFINVPDSDCGDVNLLIDRQLARVRERIAAMQALECQLTALRGRCGRIDCVRDCGILNELVAAARDEGCVCHRPSASGQVPLTEGQESD